MLEEGNQLPGKDNYLEDDMEDMESSEEEEEMETMVRCNREFDWLILVILP